jgi:methylglutaconyl-CoA hydratase
MPDLLIEIKEQTLFLTLNRIDKHNAFDDNLLHSLQLALESSATAPELRLIILKAHGKHFSAGADVSWMQRVINYSEEDNIADAKILASVMSTLHHHPLPTIAMVQGAAFGGGAGLVAACDLAIASEDASFCFSEVKLGLIPAVISPYIIKAIGERAALSLFLTGEVFDAHRALELQLINQCVPRVELLAKTLALSELIKAYAPMAVKAIKSLVRQVSGRPLNEALEHLTAGLIAKQRVSPEGQQGLKAFIEKHTKS